MASEKNAATTTVSWNSKTLEVVSSTLPAITRDEDVENPHTAIGAINAKVLGERSNVGDATIVAKFDAALYADLVILAGNATEGTPTVSDMVWTLDSGATVTVDDMGLKAVSPAEFTIGDAPTMSLTFGQHAPTGGVLPTSA